MKRKCTYCAAEATYIFDYIDRHGKTKKLASCDFHTVLASEQQSIWSGLDALADRFTLS